MVDRRQVSSAGNPAGAAAPTAGEYAGQRLGLPETGSGSLARWGRRIGAVFVDWMLCMVVAVGLFRMPWGATGAQGFLPLGIFAVENLVLLATAGFTVGHRLFGMQLRSMTGAPANPVQVLIRTALLCLALPAVVWDRDGRGMHDRFASTVLVRS